MNFQDIDWFKKQGFEGFITVEQLMMNTSLIPKKPGVYGVFHLEADCDFLEIGCGGYFKFKNPNVPLSILTSSWVERAILIYIGKAGGNGKKSTLQSRLRQYLSFGRGKSVGHYGGRLIWQIKDSKKLVIAWKQLENEEPRDYEMNFIKQFVNEYKKRPFANLVD